MSRKPGLAVVLSLDDALSLLEPGECLVFVVPPVGLADRLAELTLRAATRADARSLLVSFEEHPDAALTSRASAQLSLGTVITNAGAFALFRKKLDRLSRNTLLIFDHLRPSTAWNDSPARAAKFLEQASALSARKGVRSVWLCRSDRFTDEQWAGVKDKSDFFVTVFSVGLALFAQIVKAKGVYSREFFFPRHLVVTDTVLEFDRPVIPSFAQHDETSAAGSPPIQAVVDILDIPYRRIFESSPDGVVLFDLKGRYREANRRAGEMLGYTPDELAVQPLAALVAPEARWKVLRALVMLRKKGKATLDSELVRKSGRRVNVSAAASLVDRGRYVVVVRETGEKVKAAGELAAKADYYQNLFASSPHPQAIVANRKLVLWNNAFRESLGLAENASAEGKSLTGVLGKQNETVVRDLFSPAPGAEGSSGKLKRDIVIVGKGSGSREFEVTAVPIIGDKAFHLTCVDITARRRALHAIEESERRYREVIETTAGAVSVVRDGKYLFVNRGFLELFGYAAPSDLVGNDITVCVVPRERSSFLEKSEPANARGMTTSFQYTGLRKDGSRLQIDVTTETALYESAPALICYHRDVSAQKSYDDAVRRKAHTHQILDRLIESLAEPTDTVAVIQSGLEAAIRSLGFDIGGVYTVNEQAGTYNLSVRIGLPEKVAAALAEQSAAEGVTGYVAKTLEPLILTVPDYPPFLPYKSLFEAEQMGVVVYVPLVAGGRAAGILLLSSPRESAVREPEILASIGKHFGAALEKAYQFDRLQSAELRYRTSVESITDIVYQQALPEGTFLYISPQIERLLGFKPEEFIRSADLWRSIVHPDDRTKYSRRISSQGEASGAIELEYRMLPKGKAAYRWVRDGVNYVRDENGDVQSIQGCIVDITRQIESLQSLSRAAELDANTLEAIEEGVVVFDRDLTCIAWNRAMETLTGFSRQQVLMKSVTSSGMPFGGAPVHAILRRTLEGEPSSINDVKVVRYDDGTEHALSIRCAPLRDGSGAIAGVAATAAYAREEKSGEGEARESEETLREVINAMGDALLISDLQGRIREVNREFTRLTGYTRAEVQGLDFPYPWHLDEEAAKFVRWISELRSKQYLHDFDMTWRHKDGHDTAISLNTTLFRNAAGEPVAMLNIARDIGERRRLANELSTRNKQIEMLNRIISKANQTVDFGDIFETIAAEVRNLLEYDEINVGILTEDREGMTLYACVCPGRSQTPLGIVVPLDKTVPQLAIARERGVAIGNLGTNPELGPKVFSLQEGLKCQLSIPVILNEKILGALNVASVTEDRYGREDMMILQPIADQIGAMIDRSRLFRRVSDDSTYIHNLLNSIDSIVVTIDRNYRIREVNEAWKEFADLQGLEQYREESTVMGESLEKVITLPALWKELQAVLPQLFDRSLSFFLTEVEIGSGADRRTFQLVVNPMIINEKVTGLVFTHTDISDIVKTEAEVKRRNEELVALNAVSSSITRSLNLAEVLEVAIAQVKEMVQADVVLCYLRDEAREKLLLARTFGVDALAASHIQSLEVAPRPLRGVSAGAREPLFISAGTIDDPRITPSVRTMFEQLGREILVALPLQSKDHVLGALVLGFNGEHPTYEQEKRFLTLLGNQVGSAIENAQLYAELQAQVQRISSLAELGKGLTGALDTSALLELVCAEIFRSIPVLKFSYEAFVERTLSLRSLFRSVHGDGGGQTADATPEERPLEHGSPFWTVVTTGVPFLGQSPEGGPLLIVPVKSHQKVSGMLWIEGKQGTTYHQTHLRLLESIANLTEIALDRVVLYDDTVAKSQEIENRNRELDDFAYVVSHDLKEPLITIEGYSKIVLIDYKDRLPDEGKQYLASVVQSSTRMKSLIDDLLTLSRVGRVSETPAVVSVREIINEVLHDFEFTLRERNAVVHVPEAMPDLRYDATQLSMVFRNLISNAVKFNIKSTPEVTIGVREEPDEFIFSVKDNGIGIAREHFERVFVIFQRLHRSEQYIGTGAGLTIVKKIVERHHGRIWLESVAGEGTTFFFTAPRI